MFQTPEGRGLGAGTDTPALLQRPLAGHLRAQTDENASTAMPLQEQNA